MNKTFYGVFDRLNNYFYNFNLDALYLDRYNESRISHLSESESYARQIWAYAPDYRVLYKVVMTDLSGEDQ